MIQPHYHFLGHEKHVTSLDGKDFCYIELLNLLNKDISANYDDRFYKDDFLERRVNFFIGIFNAKNLDCAHNINAISSAVEGGTAAICLRFPPSKAEAVNEAAMEIEAAAAKSRLAFAPFQSCNVFAHPKFSITKFSAQFKKLNDQQASDVAAMITSTFAAHEAFDSEISIDNKASSVTEIGLTFPFFRPATAEIVAMEITNAAAMTQGTTPIETFRQHIPITKSTSAKRNEMN